MNFADPELPLSNGRPYLYSATCWQILSVETIKPEIRYTMVCPFTRFHHRSTKFVLTVFLIWPFYPIISAWSFEVCCCMLATSAWKETFFFKFLTKSWQEKPFSRPQNCLVEHISILMNSLMQIFSIINFSFYHIHTDLHTQYWLVSELLSTLAFTIMVHPTSLGKICKAVCLPNR